MIDLKAFMPKTHDEAAAYLVYNLTDEDRAYIAKEGAESSHFTAGMAIRNEWGLWENSSLAQWYQKNCGLGHADDMSGLILENVSAVVRGEPFDVTEAAKEYRAYWAAKGIDPLTQRAFTPDDSIESFIARERDCPRPWWKFW